jgi:hypothetical protein
VRVVAGVCESPGWAGAAGGGGGVGRVEPGRTQRALVHVAGARAPLGTHVTAEVSVVLGPGRARAVADLSGLFADGAEGLK